jgi:hypothetical protein
MTTRVKFRRIGCKNQRTRAGRFLDFSETVVLREPTIIVRDLFFQYARAARLSEKAGQRSRACCARWWSGSRWPIPKVSIRLISNGRTLLHSYGDDSMLHAALAVYGRETAAL